MSSELILSHQDIEHKLETMQITLPTMPKPSGNYTPYVFAPPYLYVSGITPKENGVSLYKGSIGADLTPEQGYAAARHCAISQLGVIKEAIGSLENVEQIVKVVGFVNNHGDFYDLPAVINGASDLLIEIFGERGRHARSAVGVASLPGGASVEIEMIVKVRT